MQGLTCTACNRGKLRIDSDGAYCPECGRFSDVRLVAYDYEGDKIGEWQCEVVHLPAGEIRVDLDAAEADLHDWWRDRNQPRRVDDGHASAAEIHEAEQLAAADGCRSPADFLAGIARRAIGVRP